MEPESKAQVYSEYLKDIDLQEVVVTHPRPDQSQELLDFMCSEFGEDEPLIQSLQCTREEIAPLLHSWVKLALRQPHFSLVVRRRDDRRIIACVLNTVASVDEICEPNVSPLPAKAYKVMKLMNDVKQPLRQYDVQGQCMEIIALSVALGYHGRGLGKLLVQMSVDLARRARCHMVVSEATAYGSQKIFRRFKFDLKHEIKTNDYLDDDRHVIFPVKPGTTESAQFVCKVIN